jgi:uncharacterized Tic20 family protein
MPNFSAMRRIQRSDLMDMATLRGGWERGGTGKGRSVSVRAGNASVDRDRHSGQAGSPRSTRKSRRDAIGCHTLCFPYADKPRFFEAPDIAGYNAEPMQFIHLFSTRRKIMSENIQETTPETRDAISIDDKNMAMLAHLLSILTGLLSGLIIWLLNKDKPEKAFVVDHAKEALNFQITLFVAYCACWVLSLILIGILMFVIVWIASIVLCIIAGLAAGKGERYRYPFALRLIK